jgi:hypothetical protein
VREVGGGLGKCSPVLLKRSFQSLLPADKAPHFRMVEFKPAHSGALPNMNSSLAHRHKPGQGARDS